LSRRMEKYPGPIERGKGKIQRCRTRVAKQLDECLNSACRQKRRSGASRLQIDFKPTQGKRRRGRKYCGAGIKGQKRGVSKNKEQERRKARQRGSRCGLWEGTARSPKSKRLARRRIEIGRRREKRSKTRKFSARGGGGRRGLPGFT